MNRRRTSFDAAFRVWLREERARSSMGPPTEEELLLYRDRNLPSERRQEIRQMLVRDSELAATYLELIPRATDEEKDQVWQQVLETANTCEGDEALPLDDAEERLSSPRPQPIARRLGGDKHSSRPAAWHSWLAAGWLVTTVGLGAWIYLLKTTEEEGSATFASLSVLAPGPGVEELLPVDLISRSDSEAPIVSASRDAGPIVLFLASAAPRFTEYRAELRAGSQVVGQVDGLKRRESGQIVVFLASRSLPAGDYELTVYGRIPAETAAAPSSDDPIGIYPFRLERLEPE